MTVNVTTQSSESISFLELLVKTHYHTVTTIMGDQDIDKYLCYGSGFIAQYRDTFFFVTADHVLHPDDYDCKIRTGIDNIVSIYNNVKPDTDYIATVLTPLGGFYYMEGLKMIETNLNQVRGQLKTEELKNKVADVGSSIIDGIGSLVGTSKVKRQ